MAKLKKNLHLNTFQKLLNTGICDGEQTDKKKEKMFYIQLICT